jgi:fermentation-respiration switch protein FrsA (DUF1100 family)
MTTAEQTKGQDTAAPTTITVTRYRLQPAAPGRRGPTGWAYNYTVDGGSLCQYGPGLGSLRARLKQKFPGAVVVLTWETSA